MKKLTLKSLTYALSAGAAGCAMIVAALVHSPVGAQSADTVGNSPDSGTNGKVLYEQICQACHMADAKGAVGAGTYPALAGDPALASRQFIALTVLMGRRNMPAFGAKHAPVFGGPPLALTNAQIAAVINYVRSNFGNHFKDTITPDEVAALDQSAN